MKESGLQLSVVKSKPKKVISLADHNRCMQSNEPIRTQSKYLSPVSSAGKRVRASHDGFGFTSDRLRKWRKVLFANHKA